MFITYPQNYNSLYSELSYRYESDVEGDITLFVTDTLSDEILGVKKFYSTSTADINIAPLVREYVYPDVTLGDTSFLDPYRQGVISVAVGDGADLVSDPRIFSLSKFDEMSVGLISTLPATNRAMSVDESEQIRLRVDPLLPIEMEQRQYIYGESEPIDISSLECEAQSLGFATFNFLVDTPADYNVERIELDFIQDDAVIAQLQYTIIDPPEEATRVAWISHRGTIEHYTFPTVEGRRFDTSGETTLTLSSAYEEFVIRQALSEIIDSPRVWVILDRGISELEYREVKVVSSEMEISPRAALAVVELSISYER